MARKKRQRPELEREGQIRCRYCGGFYDPSLAQCPNCGNRTEENQSYTTDWRTISPEECAGGFGGADHMIRRAATYLGGALVVLFIIVSIAGVTKGMAWASKGQNTRPTPVVSDADSSAEPDASTEGDTSAEPDKPQTGGQAGTQPDTVPDPEGILLNYTDVTMQATEELALTAEVTPKDWKGTVTWSTDDQYVAWVDQSGKVVCMGGGNCLITAKAGGKTATCQVRCTGAAADHAAVDAKIQELERQQAKDKLDQMKPNTTQGANGTEGTKPEDKPDDKPEDGQNTDEPLTLSLTDLTLMAVGHTYQFQVTGGDGNYTWSSAGEWVATVDQNGVVTGVGQGMATITCTDGTGKSASCIVHVL